MVLLSCQDTGTAIVIGKKGQLAWTTGNDEGQAAISEGVWRTFTETNLRYSQMVNAADDLIEGEEHGDNLPAQIELYAERKAPRTSTASLFMDQGRRLGEQERSCTRRRRRS